MCNLDKGTFEQWRPGMKVTGHVPVITFNVETDLDIANGPRGPESFLMKGKRRSHLEESAPGIGIPIGEQGNFRLIRLYLHPCDLPILVLFEIHFSLNSKICACLGLQRSCALERSAHHPDQNALSRSFFSD